jgi:hypothetical protein
MTVDAVPPINTDEELVKFHRRAAVYQAATSVTSTGYTSPITREPRIVTNPRISKMARILVSPAAFSPRLNWSGRKVREVEEGKGRSRKHCFPPL